MATTTPNYGLRKPTNTDNVNVALDIAGNMDLLDAHAHSGTYGALATANTWAGTQSFTNATSLMALGTDLLFKLVVGNGAQRLHLTGVNETTNPFFEIVPGTTTPDTYALDATVSGFQVYRVGKGSAVNREFFAIEAGGVGQNFIISSWASGTGTVRSLKFQVGTQETGAVEAFRIRNDAKTVIGSTAQLMYDGGTQPVPVMLRNNSDLSLELRVHSASAADVPRFFAGRTRGTAASPTVPQSGDILGDFRAGSFNAEAQVPSGLLRFKATQNWTFGSAQGTNVEVRLIPDGSASFVSAAIFQEPADGQVALLIRRNVGGTLTQQQVSMGVADSGGAGYKLLRVPN